jgi:hypothetical protein
MNFADYKVLNANGLLVGRAMAQAVRHRPLTAEDRIRARINPCGFYGGQSGSGTGFSPISSVSSVNIIPPWFSMLIYHLGGEQ